MPRQFPILYCIEACDVLGDERSHLLMLLISVHYYDCDVAGTMKTIGMGNWSEVRGE